MSYQRQRGQFGRINGSDLGKLAITTFVCCGCGLFYERKMPGQCVCGRMDFDRFMSWGEATRWMQLRLLVRAKEITNLQRQVRFALMTVDINGNPVKFADYIADFTYEEGSDFVIEDYKSKSGIDPVAALKLRIMEASGRPVRLVTS